jgi:carboxypeptidase C (cathepsin A)
VFFMAYSLDRQPGEPARPLTFLWNGGPGANSVLVLLVAFGPRRIKTGDDPTAPRTCECELEDNQTTWLDKTDLVFVDPIGTGFSRPAKAEYAADFYSTLGDIAATAEFIRVYRTAFDAWEAPLFLGGESFGTWRAAGAAETLERKGIRVAGVLLISGGMVLGSVGSEEMRTALFIPARTAAAFHHKRLPADLQTNLQTTLGKAEAWARDEYAPALARRDQLTDAERDGIVAQLARFTGLDQSLIDRKTLVVARQAFAEQLLKDQQRVLGRFDTRQATGGGEARGGIGRQALLMRYLRSVLQFKTDLAYQGVEEGWMPSDAQRRGVNARWNYNVPEPPPGTPPPPGPRNTDAPPGGQPWLRRAIGLNPSLKAFVAAGLYDSLNSCPVNEYLKRTVEPEIARNLSLGCYEGGHMMYEDRGARLQLKRDVDVFFDSLKR